MEPLPESPTEAPDRDRQARSFGRVVDAYDRARPQYPDDAVAWLLGDAPRRVVELGAGTGKLTSQLVTAGHKVLATDPSEPMARRLAQRVPAAQPALATAEQIPVLSGSADAVISAQAFHWFDVDVALTQAARVLRTGGTLALLWNHRDERVPWVRRLGRILSHPETQDDPTAAIDDSGLFEQVERKTFRFWQPTTRDSLRELVTSRSYVATMSESGRADVLAQVDELYAEYGRGADGMLMPYVTTAYRTSALPWAQTDAPEERSAAPARRTGGQALDTDSLLIDFR